MLGLVGMLGGAPAEAPVQMSPYEVSANSVEFQGWRKAASPNFVIYTDARAKDADVALRELEMLHAMAQGYFRRKAINRPPMVFVLPTGGSDWRKIESMSGVQWRVAISDPAHTLLDLIVAHYDWQQNRTLVFAEFGRAELKALNLPEPLWFQRGMMGFFDAANVSGDSVSLGHLSYKAGHVVRGGWLPWRAVFRVNFQSPEYVESEKIGRLNGQTSVFVQYLLTHKEPVWVDRLMEWVAITESNAEPSESEFKRVFGQDWKNWEKAMDTYLRGGEYRISSLRFPKGALETKATHTTPPVREMRELFVLVQILNQRVPASSEALEKLLAKGLKTEGLRELLVEACLARDHPDLALAELRKIITAGNASAEVYALVSSLGFRARVREVTLAGQVGEGAEELRVWSEKAVEMEPRHREANHTGAWLAALAPAVGAPQIEAIKGAYKRLAGQASTMHIVAALAVALHRSGEVASARGLAQKLLDSPYTDREPRGVAMEILREGSPP